MVCAIPSCFRRCTRLLKWANSGTVRVLYPGFRIIRLLFMYARRLAESRCRENATFVKQFYSYVYTPRHGVSPARDRPPLLEHRSHKIGTFTIDTPRPASSPIHFPRNTYLHRPRRPNDGSPLAANARSYEDDEETVCWLARPASR